MTHTSAWISKGWQMVTANFWSFVLAALLYLLVMAVGSAASWIIGGPALAAVYGVILYLLRTGRLDFDRLQDGFQVFVPAMLVGIVAGIFTAVGFAFCIVPGIILSALYLFPLLLVLDRRMPFWEAMEESRKKVQQDLLGFLGFVLALFGINVLGALVCGVGMLVSIPVTWCATAVAYQELWPEPVTTILPPAQTET